MEPKQEIEQLTRELEHAGYLYYVSQVEPHIAPLAIYPLTSALIL